MGSCVSKKSRGADRKGKAAAPLPPVKEMNALSPVAEEEEVKEVVLSETPAPRLAPRPPLPVEKRQEQLSEASSGSGSDESGSVAAKEKAMAKAGGDQQEVVKRAVDAHASEKARARRTASPEKAMAKARRTALPKQGGGAGTGRARSPSPSSAHRRQQPPLPPPPTTTRPPRREPAVVSGIGCRSGRFSPSTARRAAESAVRRTHSAREADMSLPAKRSLNASIDGGHGHSAAACFFGGGGNTLGRRDPGERSGRRSDSPTQSKRPSPSPSPMRRQASATRRAAPAPPARENCCGRSTPERSRPRGVVRDVGPDDDAGRDEHPASAGGTAPAGEHKKPQDGALGQNPSVAMECFIFL